MIHQSLTKDLKWILWLYQLLFSHLLEGLVDVLCKTCWCDQKRIFKKAHCNTNLSLDVSIFLLFFNANFSCTIRKCWRECRLLHLSPEVSLFCCIVVEQKTSLRSEGEKKNILFREKEVAVWWRLIGSIWRLFSEDVTLSEQPWHLSTARS